MTVQHTLCIFSSGYETQNMFADRYVCSLTYPDITQPTEQTPVALCCLLGQHFKRLLLRENKRARINAADT